MIKLLVGYFLITALVFGFNLSGDHVCHRQENYTEIINLTSAEPIQIRKNFWCLEKIRCSELKPEIKEVVHSENVTKTRSVTFCCPDYEEAELDGRKFCKPICSEKCLHGYCESPGKCDCEIGYMGASCNQSCPPNRFGKMCIKFCKCGDDNCHPQTGECVKFSDITTSTAATVKSVEKVNITTDPFMKSLNQTRIENSTSTEHNPYENYSGEYGKEFNHYVKMGLNESDVQESIDKIVRIEIKTANEELRQRTIDDDNGFIILDVSGNDINDLEPLKHPQYVTDHHGVSHHEESIAMVTVGCLILGMLVFLLAMVYIRRVTRRLPPSRDIDPEADLQKFQRQLILEPSKIIHEPLPIPPLRPSLRKHKSVTFDESIDEVDDKKRKRAQSLTDTYDIPRKQNSMVDLYAQSVKLTKNDFAIYSESQKPNFNTFPRKSVSRKQSLEHIYDEIPVASVIKDANREQSEKIEDLCPTNELYENQESIEKTKM